MPILETNDGRLTETVRRVSAAARGITSLGSISLRVEVTTPTVGTQLASMQVNPARYDDAGDRIEVFPVFFERPEEERDGIIAHELGEAAAARSAPELVAVSELNRDLQADYFACLIGFRDSLAMGRGDRGRDYHEALNAWETPETYAQLMGRWRNMRIVGTDR